ncbi:Rab small GTPase domain-containing protein [Trichomonas vaginalis G3]|uniref:Rab small GTPase domain-containing protein n=1 Tax=Trichomonas vaginalis (strain ATCC PRA-98 / G3) TaxID=412133 RepID=UPI0021E5A3A0|nr:Rab small GTPase domain-containing protein [Trichomonas vaginalis G3]KAI5537461.1 Rab small GTPase domain-containing protein [Trichomonas vaginalis G3]
MKIVVIGETQVGKTCLLRRLYANAFTNNIPQTIGAAFQNYVIQTQKGKVELQLWDTAGQEKFRSLTPMYYRLAAFAVICFDLTNKPSFEALESWYTDIIEKGPPRIQFVIVGTKKDCQEDRVISFEEAMNFAESHGTAFYIETSAKTGENVRELFLRIAQLYESKPENVEVYPDDSPKEKDGSKSKCC